ncbi:hypothetical protein AVEN_102106-1 [Araneus ventricosus]|uniref:C2H2-type domain-containing protein n=1 Tax=Araneus ventricosus TaxID=182803 RepID=A0A4Y2V251_ARAVE|nr:hypothetical protein AVEN_102106-1 [Araneus ventricosus]
MIDSANDLHPEGLKPGPPAHTPFSRKSFADVATNALVNSDHISCETCKMPFSSDTTLAQHIFDAHAVEDLASLETKTTPQVKNPVKSRPTWLHCDGCQVRFASVRGLDAHECTGPRPTFSGVFTASNRKLAPPEKMCP